MILAFTLIHCLVLIGFLIAVIRSGLQLRFPFLFTFVYIAFVTIPLLNFGLSTPLLIKPKHLFFSFFSVFCLLGCLLGFNAGSLRRPKVSKRLSLNTPRLNWIVLFFAIGGVFANWIYISKGVAESMYEGESLLYNFFVPAARGALYISIWRFSQGHRSKYLTLAVLIVLIGYYLPNILLFFKRNVILDIILVALFHYRIVRLRKVQTMVLVLVLSIYSALSVRGIRKNLYESFILNEQIDWKIFLKKNNSNEAELPVEIIVGVDALEAIRTEGNYDYGAYHWNRFVFNYVPGQLVGRKKEELLIKGIDIDSDLRRQKKKRNFYTTATGFVDAYKSFSYFGFLKFVLIGLIMGFLYNKSEFALFYNWSLVASLHTITHNTQWIPNILIQGFLFLSIPLLLALKFK